MSVKGGKRASGVFISRVSRTARGISKVEWPCFRDAWLRLGAAWALSSLEYFCCSGERLRISGEDATNAGAERRAMGGAAAASRRGSPARQDGAPRSAADDRGHPLAAPERRQVARHPRRAGAVVERGADLHP